MDDTFLTTATNAPPRASFYCAPTRANSLIPNARHANSYLGSLYRLPSERKWASKHCAGNTTDFNIAITEKGKVPKTFNPEAMPIPFVR